MSALIHGMVRRLAGAQPLPAPMLTKMYRTIWRQLPIDVQWVNDHGIWPWTRHASLVCSPTHDSCLATFYLIYRTKIARRCLQWLCLLTHWPLGNVVQYCNFDDVTLEHVTDQPFVKLLAVECQSAHLMTTGGQQVIIWANVDSLCRHQTVIGHLYHSRYEQIWLLWPGMYMLIFYNWVTQLIFVTYDINLLFLPLNICF